MTIMSQYGAGGGVKGRRCDATCHKATKPECACICGGRYHGRGSSEAAQEQLTKDWLGDDWKDQVERIRREAVEVGSEGHRLTQAQAAYKLFAERVKPRLEAATG